MIMRERIEEYGSADAEIELQATYQLDPRDMARIAHAEAQGEVADPVLEFPMIATGRETTAQALARQKREAKAMDQLDEESESAGMGIV